MGRLMLKLNGGGDEVRWRSLGASGLMPADKDNSDFPAQLQTSIVVCRIYPEGGNSQLLNALLDVFVGRNWRPWFQL